MEINFAAQYNRKKKKKLADKSRSERGVFIRFFQYFPEISVFSYRKNKK